MTTVKTGQDKLKYLFGLVRFLIIFAIVLIIAGYGLFLLNVSRPAPVQPLAQADGIVVLTGDGNRLETAGKIFAQHKAERMLVTGIHENVPDEDIRKLLSVPQNMFNCCIDLDHAAENTIGNARETAIWVKALGYEHIILVTSDYHMPRAKLEITSATGGMRITPYPVSTRSDKTLWHDLERHKLLAKEYSKLLVIYASRMGDRPINPPQPVPAPIDVMKKSQEPPSFTGPHIIPNDADALSDVTPETAPE